MGRTIEESRTTTPMSNEEIVDTLKTMVFGVQAFERFNAKERETLDKAWNIIDQYETRLKADKIAMLEEIESMFWELTKNKYDMQILYEKADNFEADFNSFIQRKIDSLKGDSDVC